jgi:RNAse (barnase) inhibitor barstar
MQPPRWLKVTTDPAPAVVDGRATRTRAAFFAEVARVLDFPDYFGHNWDALVDSLRDTEPVDVLVTHAEELLAEEPLAQLAVLLDILGSTDGLTLTLATDPAHEKALRQRVAGALGNSET